MTIRGFASHFSHVPEAPPDKILGLNELYNADKNPNKINLGVGAYRDDNGKVKYRIIGSHGYYHV